MDNKMSIFEEYGAFKTSVFKQMFSYCSKTMAIQISSNNIFLCKN